MSNKKDLKCQLLLKMQKVSLNDLKIVLKNGPKKSSKF